MKIYIVYRLSDYAVPQAISLNRKEAEKFMNILKKHDQYIKNYWVEEKIVTNNITEI